MQRLPILLLPLGAAAEEYCTITQLRAQTLARWTQTYVTPWRDIAVDTPVLVPQTDALPVITAAYDLNEVVSASAIGMSAGAPGACCASTSAAWTISGPGGPSTARNITRPTIRRPSRRAAGRT